MEWIIDRLREPTTYAGIFAVLTSLGVSVAPELADAIMATGIAATGLALVFIKEQPKP